MSVLSELGANYKSPSVTFPYKTGSVGNIYTPNFINSNNVPSATNTIIVSSALTQGVYSIQGFIQITPTAGQTLVDGQTTVQLEVSDNTGALVQSATFFGTIANDSVYYIPINWTFNALETQAAGSPNFTLAVDATTTTAVVYNIGGGTINITKIA
jgi:hypothetical protein